MERVIYYYFNLEFMYEALPVLLKGLVITLELSAITIVGGVILGLLLAVSRALRIKVLNFFIIVFVDVFRAIPPLVILIFAYFGLPYAGIIISPFWCAALTLVLVLAAVAEEVFWAGIIAVERGQWEAARSTGLGFFTTLVYIVTPQAIRLVIPPLTNKVISITKNAALASVVAVPELLNQAITAQGVYANPSPLTLAALMFILIFFPLVRFSSYLEKKYHYDA
jgi:polar amino acid transport system permease protein